MPATNSVELSLNAPVKVARWRVIGNPVMAIPHFFVVAALGTVAGVLSYIAWFAILFTGNIPQGMYGFITGVLRYQWRVTSFYLFLREPYPAFGVTSTDVDPGDDPATLSIPYPQKLSRGLIFVKWILAIPVMVWLVLLVVASYLVLVIAFLAVLITGEWPEGLRNFVIGVFRLGYRLSAYTTYLTDTYPGFSLK